MVPKIQTLTFIIFALILSGCNFPAASLAPTIDLVATAVAGTLAAQNPPTATSNPELLPHPVFFLNETSGLPQIWRLERDGIAKSQVTFEEYVIQSFDTSPIDGSLAYVSNNQLYLANADGTNRRLLVDNASANTEEKTYIWTEKISDPLFSPDGESLIYAFNGIWFLDLATNQAIQLLTNEIQEADGVVTPGVFYLPVLWSPDSQKLLITIGGFETNQPSILNLGEGQTLTDLNTDNNIFCCQAAWAPDSLSVLVASPYIGLIEPGLWSFVEDTGEGSEILGSTNEGMFQFAGWPLGLEDGSLRYFFTSSTEIPANDLALYMVRSDEDNSSSPVQLRPDAFINIGEVLWADDGSLALIMQTNPPSGTTGSVVLAYADDRQIQLLLSNARNLKWGR